MKNIAMVTLARSGSSYFTRSVQKNFNFLKGTAEIFHPNKGFKDIMNNIYEHNNLSVSEKLQAEIDRVKFCSTYEEKPELILKLLSDIAIESDFYGVFFKIMEGHLYNQCRDLERIYDLGNTNFFFLTRSVADSIISLLKAREKNIWENNDTTNMKIHVNPDEFLDIFQRDSKWLNKSYEFLSTKTEIRKIKYEEIFNELNKPNETICKFINKYVGDDLHIEEYNHMDKQDRNEGWEYKVKNSDEVKKVILNNGIPEHYSNLIDNN